MNSSSTSPVAMITCMTRVVEGDVGAGLDLAVHVGVVGDALAARGSTTISLVPRRRACLKNVAGDRVVGGRVGAGEDRDVGVDDVAVGRRHRARADRPRAAPPRTRRGTAACSGRRCWCRSRRGSASGRGRPPRWSTWPSRSRRSRPARARRGSPSGARRRGRAPRPRWPRGSAASPRRSRRGRRACAAPPPLSSPRTSPRQRALGVGRPRGGSAAWSAAAACARSPSRSGP